ncbi:prolyl oligopeptidase family serine peptidase [Nocardia sp. NBC_01503]|uniref:prolyl oligopeptidase family serine peptidase n=1 Tax=Nocardia sp. NBC_01503 TaxID=2975997 RepID=UPI002E7B58C9|nr:prolyl oligopeptidase family serine peptidase [Nocardia sp. NBC_01503]WTL29215.1 prolyl oligopeptidase family serine peptidase [Nocardia sp. NBC_01503]
MARVGTGFGWRATIVAVVAMVVTGCGGSGSSGDQFQWLEELDSPRVQSWVAAENAKTLGVLEQDPHYADNLAQATTLANAPDRLPAPEFRDGMIGNFWQDGEHKRGIWRETTVADYEAPQPRWKTVLDLDALAAAEGRNWVWEGMNCAPNRGTRCLVNLSEGGEDALTVREFDRGTGQFVPGGFTLERGKQYVAWADDDTLLVSREWQPGEKTASGYPYIVKTWHRGAPLEQAAEVLRGDPSDGLGTAPIVLDGGNGHRVSMVVRRPSFFEAQFNLIVSGQPVRLALPPKSELEGMVGNRVLVAPRDDWTVGGTTFRSGSLISLDADELARHPDAPRPTVLYTPGPQEAFQSVMTTRGHAVVTSLYDVKGRATVYTPQPDGTWTGAPVPLPDNASVYAVDADSHGETAYLSVTALLTPSTLWSLDVADGRLVAVKSAPARFDSSRFVVEQLKADSADGTKVPYFIVHAADMKYDGSTPTIVYAYGGFGTSSTPGYNGLLGKSWLEQGGAYVIANIRGGGEYGPAWHEAALKTKRQKAFDDFTAVAADLIARDISTPRHLGIQGGSNGGLLMGVEFTQHPELWNAVDIQVPLLDMERYEKIAAGASWVGEYGSMSVPDERDFLESISPYARLRSGVKYPEPFVWTTTKDDRVGPQHARKFAARLSALDDPYFFYEAPQGGHGAGADNDEKAHTNALEYTYFMRQLM